MSITITTLANATPADQTFTLLGKDRLTAEWLNATSETSTNHSRLTIKQQTIKANLKRPGTTDLRRWLVQYRVWTPVTSVAANGNSIVRDEEIVINVTCTSPTSLVTFTETTKTHIMAILRNFLTSTTVLALSNGEV